MVRGANYLFRTSVEIRVIVTEISMRIILSDIRTIPLEIDH